ncbi:MAG TPA: phosphatase PAP2 family protein [Nitrococcus sp.]|nr:phosphatase PAP2 family protein [Nitrococcus sp.]
MTFRTRALLCYGARFSLDEDEAANAKGYIYDGKPVFLTRCTAANGATGRQLAFGLAVFIGASWLFGEIAGYALNGNRPPALDVRVAHWFYAHGAPGLTQFMLLVTHLNGALAISAYTVLLAAFLAWQRIWYWLVALLLVVPGGMLINVIMKHAFQRPRPHFEHPLLTLTTYSFPSGHVAAATLWYGLLAALIVVHVRARHWRALAITAAFLLIALVASTRLYLGVHYLSDVLAAFAEGVAWLALCLTALSAWWQRAAGLCSERGGGA